MCVLRSSFVVAHSEWVARVEADDDVVKEIAC